MAFLPRLTRACAALFAALVLPALAAAQITQLRAVLNGAQETPPVATAATGVACLVLDQTAGTLTFNITYAGLGSPEIAAHIHQGAVGTPGGVIFGLPGANPKLGMLLVSPAQATLILSGNTYINIHTSVFGGGEIRGQILVGACPGPGLPFCSGPTLGADHLTACPCGNAGSCGCAHSFGGSGCLDATGTTLPDTSILQANGLPATSFTLFMQHDAAGDVVFHDGVLCASGTLVRLRGRNAVAGSAIFPNSAFPNDATLTLSQRGGVIPGSGAVRRYAAFYRNASTTFCPPATANVTNGYAIVW